MGRSRAQGIVCFLLCYDVHYPYAVAGLSNNGFLCDVHINRVPVPKQCILAVVIFITVSEINGVLCLHESEPITFVCAGLPQQRKRM